MKRHLLLLITCLLSFGMAAQSYTKKTPTIYIDSKGVMRWSDTRQEASFYGVNYTLPFAHAYRAIHRLGIDPKAAIDRDVYHFARLGFNAYRIHLWDVELTDGEGNLQSNDHLDLMDYLIFKLKERGIRIVITAQTNFGNGYPERNEPTGGFSYKYDKCNIHSNPEAIAAQERYLSGLVQHVNPYTGLAYQDDPFVVGFEINNEPCHSGTKEEVKSYIDRMLNATKQAGNRKPVFYNVSHNGYVVDAYYDTNIQGTTYQWYPIGLVSGYTRTGNYLPYVDSYPISFSQVKGFGSKAKLVYEFDPADILYSYMYPAMTRTFRSAGFQWITQFAYDPIDMAYANTEYQTHFLNLAYTPKKAISMKIAAEAARSLKKDVSYGVYPQDTLFGNGFRVSYSEDLSELNDGSHFYYSNSTRTQPRNAGQLISIAGCGNSTVIRYEGTGAYFVDRLEPGVWRLEVMPDAVVVNDPFAKPSPEKEVVTIAYGAWDMAIQLPDLGTSFTMMKLNKGTSDTMGNPQIIGDGILRSLQPGTYLLQRSQLHPKQNWTADSSWNGIRLGEFVAPAERAKDFTVTHTPAIVTEAGCPLTIIADIVGPQLPDSVIIYTDKISFWNEHNPSIRMRRVNGYTYQATVPATEIKEGTFRYNILVCHQGKSQTYPGEGTLPGKSFGIKGSPLDWDYVSKEYWQTPVVAPLEVILLADLDNPKADVERYDGYAIENKYFLRANIKGILAGRRGKLTSCTSLCMRVDSSHTLPEGTTVGFVTSDGYTYKASCAVTPSSEGIVRIPFSELKQTDTALLPVSYPVFLPRYFHPVTDIPFQIGKAEQWELSFENVGKENLEKEKVGKMKGRPDAGIGNIWLE